MIGRTHTDRAHAKRGRVAKLSALALFALGAFAVAPAPRALAQDADVEERKRQDAIADEIARKDPNVWTLQLRWAHPRRLEIKKELGTPEVYWYVYYEITNIDKLERPCFIDVTAESDKGKNRHHYHDGIFPEVKEELLKILPDLKPGEVLHTQTELRMPPAGQTNALPKKDGAPAPGEITTKVERDKESGLYKGGCATLALPMIKPGETKKCVAVFNKLDAEMDVLSIHFHGLTNITMGMPATAEQPDSLHPEASPVADGEERLVHDDPKTADPYRRKMIQRVFVVSYECRGDEFSKSSRSILKNPEQAIRPHNLERDETKPARYADVAGYGDEIAEPIEKAIEGRKTSPHTFLARKWIQIETIIKSDLR